MSKPSRKPSRPPAKKASEGASFASDLKKRGLAEKGDTTRRTDAQVRADVEAKKALAAKRAAMKKPKRGARSEARAPAEKKAQRQHEAKKKAKQEKAAPSAPRAPRQVTLEGEELPPAPAVSLEERESIQRLATAGHFRVSLDAEAMEELRTSASFVQRRAIVRDRMKALPKVEEIPAGTKDAECDEIVRAFERKYILKDVPWDLNAAQRSTKPMEPAPIIKEVQVVEKHRPTAAKPKTFETCPACQGAKLVPTRCPDPKCKEPLYAHDCGLGAQETCHTCAGNGVIACRRCGGHGEVEWTMPLSVDHLAVACPACRAKEHAEDLAQLAPKEDTKDA